MARITVEDSLKQARNRFALTILTVQRARQLYKGSKPLSEKKNNREVVTALREIAEQRVVYAHPEYLDQLDDTFKMLPNEQEFIGSEDEIE
ncbi:MAG TPA: DNA-directed RNA polymerase subunit omega [Deltaproteobacteria bacterium]|mgnify:CR=1 FL=1|nr:DNA-directed RNA polymerase subunit omega [Deltaproteobacteria bacterium]